MDVAALLKENGVDVREEGELDVLPRFSKKCIPHGSVSYAALHSEGIYGHSVKNEIRPNKICRKIGNRLDLRSVKQTNYNPVGKTTFSSYALQGQTGTVAFSDFNNLLLAKDTAADATALNQNAVLSLVFHVLFPGAPLQITQTVVLRVSVQMPTFHAWRTRSDKGKQDKTVYWPVNDATATVSDSRDHMTRIHMRKSRNGVP
jgi:hypothetical protein